MLKGDPCCSFPDLYVYSGTPLCPLPLRSSCLKWAIYIPSPKKPHFFWLDTIPVACRQAVSETVFIEAKPCNWSMKHRGRKKYFFSYAYILRETSVNLRTTRLILPSEFESFGPIKSAKSIRRCAIKSRHRYSSQPGAKQEVQKSLACTLHRPTQCRRQSSHFGFTLRLLLLARTL